MASIKETVRTFQEEPFLLIAKPRNLTVYCWLAVLYLLLAHTLIVTVYHDAFLFLKPAVDIILPLFPSLQQAVTILAEQHKEAQLEAVYSVYGSSRLIFIVLFPLFVFGSLAGGWKFIVHDKVSFVPTSYVKTVEEGIKYMKKAWIAWALLGFFIFVYSLHIIFLDAYPLRLSLRLIWYNFLMIAGPFIGLFLLTLLSSIFLKIKKI